MEKIIVTDRIDRLEEAQLELDYIKGTLRILAAAFEDSGSFSNLSPDDVEKTISGLDIHVYSAQQELDNVIGSLMKTEAGIVLTDDEDIAEIIRKMHEAKHEDASTDIYPTELQYFYDRVHSAASSDNLIDVLYDCYLFGVYRGQHSADQEES